MSGPLAAAQAATTAVSDDERSLLIRFELLLEREEEAMVAHDAVAIAAAAEERIQLTERLGEAARKRHAAPKSDAAAEAELMELYRRVRERHVVRAKVVRRHAEQNSRAIGVLAQATGQSNVYKADGTVALQFGAVVTST